MKSKYLLRKILFPHPGITAVFCVFSFALLIYCACTLEAADAIIIISYTLSFCALVLVSLRMPEIIRFIQRFRTENRFLIRYRTDLRLHMNISLISAFSFNTLYAVFQLFLGIRHHSVWFYAMAGYHCLLANMRLLLIRYTKKYNPGEHPQTEWKKYRACGLLLLFMTLILSVFILYFVLRIREFHHSEITTITMAAYTFSALGISIYNAVRFKRYESPACSAGKAVSLVSAIVSVLTLENAMLTAFGQESSEVFRKVILSVSGLAVVLSVNGIAVFMIFHARRQLKAIRNV